MSDNTGKFHRDSPVMHRVIERAVRVIHPIEWPRYVVPAWKVLGVDIRRVSLEKACRGCRGIIAARSSRAVRSVDRFERARPPRRS